MKHLRFPLFLIFLLSLFSCSETSEECEGDCTEEFRSIVVSIVDPAGAPLALDSYQVVDLNDGRNFTIEVTDQHLELMRATGSYLLFSDKYLEEFKQQQIELIFMGFVGGEEVVNETYSVRSDCCHFYHLSGDLELVVDLE